MNVASAVKQSNPRHNSSGIFAERITAHKALLHTRYWRGFSFLLVVVMGQNKHELQKNLKDYVNERERWCLTLAGNTAPFALKNLAYAHVRLLDKRIQNIQLLLDANR